MKTAGEWLATIAAARRLAVHHAALDVVDKFEAFVLLASKYDRLDCIDNPEQLFIAALADETRETRRETETPAPVSNETRRGGDETVESQPWKAEGISRSTYFRRKRLGELKHKHGV